MAGFGRPLLTEHALRGISSPRRLAQTFPYGEGSHPKQRQQSTSEDACQQALSRSAIISAASEFSYQAGQIQEAESWSSPADRKKLQSLVDLGLVM